MTPGSSTPMEPGQDDRADQLPRPEPMSGWLDRPMTEASDEPVSIGELAAEFGISTRAIRFYEDKGLINPQRRQGNRAFTQKDRVRLMLILRGKSLGFKLQDIAEYLALYDTDPAQIAQTSHLLDRIDARLFALQLKRGDLDRAEVELKDLREQCLAFLRAANKPSAT